MKNIINGLKQYKQIVDVVAPNSTGFYAFYTLEGDCFDGTELREIRQSECIYIGIAADETLYKRVIEAHLRDTGSSTLRRSIGAILRERLNLNPIMRGISATKSNISNYKFGKDDEEKLTKFMKENLAIAFYSYNYVGKRLEDIEKGIIREFGYPVFNLEYSKYTNNPYFLSIKRARKECRTIVKVQLRG